MKKIIIVIPVFFLSAVSFADQLAYITKDQAEETIAYIEEKGIKEVVLWCACCENDVKAKVTVSRVYYKYTGYKNYYQVYVSGMTSDGRSIDEGVDLAYVHIKKGKRWYCLGKELDFECNPCTKAFKM